jgi:hypothetical protein
MSRKIIFGLVVLVSLFCGSVYAEVVDIAVETRTAGRIGYTNYELISREEYPYVYSLLEFPLNTIYLGAAALWTFESAEKPDRELFVGAIINVTDPTAVMKDSDWVEPFGWPKLIFSYTESRATLTAFEIAIEGRRRIYPYNVKGLYATGGYRFLRYAENVFGYEGWYLNLDTGQPENYTPNPGDLAIEYYVNFHTAFAGLFYRWIDLARLRLEIGSDLALLFTNDYDDHVLRGKVMTAAGFGLGFRALGAIAIFPFGREHKRSLYIKLSTEANYLAANIEQTQRWYRDEDTIPAGTVISGIVHEIRSLQIGAELSVGMELK